MLSLRHHLTKCLSFLVVASLLLSSCTEEPPAKQEIKKTPSALSYSVKMVLPHDPKAFTQGLLYVGDQLYESTGGNGSWIAAVQPASGQQDKKLVLDDRYFGEGIAVLNQKVYQLTWRNKIGFVYDLASFKKLGEFHYDHEGWGITTNGHQLIVSDGTAELRWLDTTNFQTIKSVQVTENGQKIDKLNELEWAEGFIYANRWHTHLIYKIDPSKGNVVGKIDLKALADEVEIENPNVDVLNGIAYRHSTKDFLVTGKWWHKAYLIDIR